MVKAAAIAGNAYTLHCPCCQRFFTFKALPAGSNVAHCPYCKSVFGYNSYDRPTHTAGDKERKPQTQAQTDAQSAPHKPTKPINMQRSHRAMGKIEWRKMGLLTKSVPLRIGSNTIGRRDANQPSDIMFDDSYMSRKSVDIEVMPELTSTSYTFKLTVLRAANPVFVGSAQLMKGNSIYLNYGDTIKLGNTTLTFKENK